MGFYLGEKYPIYTIFLCSYFFPIFICSQSPVLQSAFAYLILFLTMKISGCMSTDNF